jgi:hypothetical protein
LRLEENCINTPQSDKIQDGVWGEAMRASGFIAVAASAFLALSTVTTKAEMTVINTPRQHFNATAVWIIFGCAGSIIFAAWAKNARQHRELTPIEAQTCGLAYWFTAQNYRP